MSRRYRIATLLKGLRLEYDKHSETLSEAYNCHLAWLREATDTSKEKIMALKRMEEEERRLSGGYDKERGVQVELFSCNRCDHRISAKLYIYIYIYIYILAILVWENRTPLSCSVSSLDYVGDFYTWFY